MRLSPGYFDRRFLRYGTTSALATALDFAVANGLHGGLGLPGAFATFLGCVAGGVLSFSLSRHWAFEAAGAGRLRQSTRFLGVWATSALLNSAGVGLLLQAVGGFPVAWALVRAGVYLGWNYPLSRWFVFAQARAQGLSAAGDAQLETSLRP